MLGLANVHFSIFLDVKSKMHNISILNNVLLSIEGKFVSIKDTVEAFKTILSGELDSVPEQAFYMTGGLDEVMSKAKELEESV